MVWKNLSLFQLASRSRGDQQDSERVGLLIPARNEEAGIAETLNNALQSEYDLLEVWILDDHSTDRTADIVQEIANKDDRVHLIHSAELPDGWNGKQHACWQLANATDTELLLFMDADVRLARGAIRRMVAEQDNRRVALLSGFPKQLTQSFAERLLIPMMYYILLGYLPLDRMRASTQPEFGAGCGQLFLARRKDYFASGGHQAIANSRHDGVKLPRAFRQAGLSTDLFDASDLAQVRMYDGFRSVVVGIMKNATEGIAGQPLIYIFTVLLGCGVILPVFSFAHAVFYGWIFIDSARCWSTILLGIATVLSFLPRFQIAGRLEESKLGAILQPLAVGMFLALQWWAFAREKLGKSPIEWRGRQ